jgi:hypothetical protein
MKKELISILDDIIKERLEYIDDIEYEKKEKIKTNIIKDLKNEISKDFFIYKIIDENHCVHKFTKGKKEGYYCSKKINTNLEIGEKKDFLCCKHSKKHKPKKKIKPQPYANNNSIIIENDKKIQNNIIDNKIDKNVYKRNKINKMYLYNRKIKIKNNKVESINSINSSFSSFNNNILYNSFNIICNSFSSSANTCKNIDKYSFCDFKHINNSINIIDFIK